MSAIPSFGRTTFPAQNRQLMPQHEQLDVFHDQAASATNKRTTTARTAR
jgi:hypothetical protein